MRWFGTLMLTAAILTGALLLGNPSPGIAGTTTVGGYGEVHFTNPDGPDGNPPGQADVARFIIYVGHDFDEKLAFFSELEIEHAFVEGGEDGGEVALEQAFLDYRLHRSATLRSGLVLMPLGIINEVHEPPTFNGVNRPDFARHVIPTTWREIGAGFAGKIPGVEGLAYRAYVTNGILAEEFDGESPIRGARQKGRKASFANAALTGRLEWSRPGLKLGGSFWYGGSSNRAVVTDEDGNLIVDLGDGLFDAPVGIVSADGRYDVGPFAFRGVFAYMSIPDAREINLAFDSDVGSRVVGGYLEGAYDVLTALAPDTTHELWAFVRAEDFDTHAEVPTGTPRNEMYHRTVVTTGLTYKPTYNVAFKADYQWKLNAAGRDEYHVFSLGIGLNY